MKVILTGKNSYIAVNICKYLTSNDIDAECISVRNGIDSIDFTGVDVIVHCAAVVHKKEADYADEYDRVNYELTKKIADKAKSQGVKHFVFMSTMAVYGITEGIIYRDTPLEPKTLYAKSKLRAEKYVLSLSGENFKITVIRPPMVYGKNCPGNYQRLSKIAKKIPIIPDTDNRKSFIYIENLAWFIYGIIEKGREGIFMPMDKNYISTAYMMNLISGKKCSKKLGTIVKLIPLNIVKKAFGSLWYGYDISTRVGYIPVSEAVRLSEE